MDIRNSNAIVIAKNCTRTASVQVTDPETVATYYGLGEVVVTDTAGTPLTTTTAVKAIPEIAIHARNQAGEEKAPVVIKGADIVGYTYENYVLPQEQVIVVDFTEFALTNHSYILKFTSYKDFRPQPQRQTVVVEVGDTALTKVQLATKFVDQINLFFDSQNIDRSSFKMSAVLADTDKVQITLNSEVNLDDGLNYCPDYQRISASVIGSEAVIVDNLTEAISYGAISADQATVGRGDFYEVRSIEKTERGFREGEYGRVAKNSYAFSLNYDTEIDGEFEADGTTVKRYDCVNIHWIRSKKSFSGDHSHRGVTKLFLPVEDNATSQVGVAATGIIAVLNKYIVTEWGVGEAVVLSTP